MEKFEKITFQVKRKQFTSITLRMDTDILENFLVLSSKSNLSRNFLIEQALSYSLSYTEFINPLPVAKTFQVKKRETESSTFRIDKDILTSFSELSKMTGLSRNKLIERALNYAWRHLEFVDS